VSTGEAEMGEVALHSFILEQKKLTPLANVERRRSDVLTADAISRSRLAQIVAAGSS
jgi:hypothetical protein